MPVDERASSCDWEALGVAPSTTLRAATAFALASGYACQQIPSGTIITAITAISAIPAAMITAVIAAFVSVNAVLLDQS